LLDSMSPPLSASAQGVLKEKAAREISFQPRFVLVELEGTAAEEGDELPAMDSNGASDAYVMLRLIPDGDRSSAYPLKGIKSSTAYRTIHPRWRETIELALKGGSLDDDGIFRNVEGTMTTSLLVRVYDADVGIWGWLFIGARIVGAALAVGALAAYISGAIDRMSTVEAQALSAAGVGVMLILATSYVASRRFRADDELIGEQTVPLAMLMDQREHTLLVSLQDPPPTPLTPPASPIAKRPSVPSVTYSPSGRRPSQSSFKAEGEAALVAPKAPSPPSASKKNASGKLGTLKLSISCSER